MFSKNERNSSCLLYTSRCVYETGVKYLVQQDNTEQKAEAELIAAILPEIGVDVTIESYDWAAMKDMMKSCLLYTSRCV